MHDPTAHGAATTVTVAAAAFTNGTDGTRPPGAHPRRARRRHTPGVSLVGVPAEHAWTTRDRLYAAPHNTGMTWPAGPLTLAVLGREVPAGDSSLDGVRRRAAGHHRTGPHRSAHRPGHRPGLPRRAGPGRQPAPGRRPHPSGPGARRRLYPRHRGRRGGCASRGQHPRHCRVRRDRAGRPGHRTARASCAAGAAPRCLAVRPHRRGRPRAPAGHPAGMPGPGIGRCRRAPPGPDRSARLRRAAARTAAARRRRAHREPRGRRVPDRRPA
jgi:hypothetical protein